MVTPTQAIIKGVLVEQTISLTGLDLIDLMIGGNEIDCLEYRMDDCYTLDFCINCDILYNEIRSSISE